MKCETSSGLTEEKFCDELGEDVECHRGVGDVVIEAAMVWLAGNRRAKGRRLDRARLRKRAPAGRDGAGIFGGLGVK